MLDVLVLSRATDKLGEASGSGDVEWIGETEAHGRVLCVDDEPNILRGLARSLRQHYDVHTADGGEAGLECIRENGPFAVVVSDMRMPGMNGATFLSEVRKEAPDTVRILLTGYSDIDAAMMAVNEGQLFRFLSKPCPTEVLLQALEGAHAQYRLVRAERDVLARTLKASVTVLVQVLNMTDPNTFYRAGTLAKYITHMTTKLALEDVWRYDLAAMLSQIGCIAIPPESLARIRVGQEVSEEELFMFQSHPEIGRRLVENIPRLEGVARMIGLQVEVGAEPDADPEVEVGGAMLRVGLAIDRLTSEGLTVQAAVARLRGEGEHDGALLDAMSDYRPDRYRETVRAIHVEDLRVGMVLNEDLRLSNGDVLLHINTELNAPRLERVRSFSAGVGLREPFRVLTSHAEATQSGPQ